MNVTPNYNYNDQQLNQTYDSYTLTTNGRTGTFNLERENGEVIKVTVTDNPASDKPGVVPFENTVQGLTVNMFNYDKDHSLDVRRNVASYIDPTNRQYKTYNSENPNDWGTTTYYRQGPYANDGINNGSALKFLGWGASNGSNRINNYDATHVTTNIVQSTLVTGADGKKYPRLNGNGNTSLEYLFSTGSSLHNDADPLYNVPGLFQQDDGYYYFNSNSNYAYLEDGQFKLYEHTYSQSTGNGITSKPIGFFPYHDFDSNNNLSPNHDKTLDHHFGMSMEVKFVLPEGKVLHKAGGVTEPISFEFSGDDDMWVFITDDSTETDMLALDVGGIHQPLTGSIDFTNDNRFQAGKEYTLRIFYLERGGCDSNCSIRFNIPLTKRPFKFEKQDAQDKNKFLKGAKFGLFKDAECKIPAVNDMNGQEYTATADENGVVSFYVSIGNYYMKELVAPAGYRLDETVRRVVLTEDGVTIQGDQDSSREGVQIANRKNPELTVENEWQTQGGTVITAPQGASATFQLKRYVRYEGEEEITDPSQPVTFKVYRYREGHTPKQVGSDYTFKGGTTVDVNWGYADYYNNWDWESVKHYKENPSGNYIYKTDPVTITLPATGEAAIYIRDENVDEEYRWGEGVKNITVSGTPYEPSTIIRPVSADWAEDTEYTGSIVTLPQDKIDAAHPWTGKFTNLTVIEVKDGITYHYKYYIVETGKTPSDSTVVYVDGSGKVISDPATLRTDENGTQKIINEVPTGSLQITKVIQKNGSTDTSASGTFYYAVYSEEYDANASPAQTPFKTGSISVTANGQGTATETDIPYGTYFVYELTGEGGTPIVSGSDGVRKAVAGTVYQVTGSGTTAVVGESIPSVTLTNNKETVNVEVEKEWQDNNNAKGNRPSQLKVTLSNGTEVTLNSSNNWKAAVNDLPKYNSEGQLIVYTWTEETIGNGYTLIGTNIDSVTGEDGAVTETTTLTNGPDEHYNPKTAFTGTKTWNDDGSIRPDEIVVILYKGEGAQKEEVERKALEKKEDGSNVWAYEFTNIPVFDEQGNVIQYSVEEVLPNGYTCSLNTGTSSAPGYERDTANDQVYVNEPNADVRVSTGVNLGFVVIKHGNDFIIWTPRKATEAELTEIKNKVAAKSNAVGDQEFSQILVRPLTNVYGVPSDGIQKGNMKASIYMDGDEVVVHFGNKNWSQLAWGQLAYTYTPGRTDLINTQKTTGLEFYKKWINSVGMESEWDKDIEVTVRRNGDSSFSLVYNLAKADIVDGKIISPTTNNDADPKIKVSVTENEGKKTYLFTIEGLDYGNENNEKYTYTVTETNDQLEGYIAPTYSNTSAPTGATVAYDKGTIINQQPGVELPSTGGPGTRLFTILGSILILGAGVLLWRRRRLI